MLLEYFLLEKRCLLSIPLIFNLILPRKKANRDIAARTRAGPLPCRYDAHTVHLEACRNRHPGTHRTHSRHPVYISYSLRLSTTHAGPNTVLVRRWAPIPTPSAQNVSCTCKHGVSIRVDTRFPVRDSTAPDLLRWRSLNTPEYSLCVNKNRSTGAARGPLGLESLDGAVAVGSDADGEPRS